MGENLAIIDGTVRASREAAAAFQCAIGRSASNRLSMTYPLRWLATNEIRRAISDRCATDEVAVQIRQRCRTFRRLWTETPYRLTARIADETMMGTRGLRISYTLKAAGGELVSEGELELAVIARTTLVELVPDS